MATSVRHSCAAFGRLLKATKVSYQYQHRFILKQETAAVSNVTH
jgi:hypothetical protein